jgi:MFS family permease
VRTFTGASAVSLVFSVAFGAMLFSRVLFAEEVWHWSALRTGLSIAPGPIMVPIFAFLVAGRLIARFGAGMVIAAGATIFTVGALWWALAAGLRPDYVHDMLGGIILTGIGVGLTLPTFMATGAAALPANAFATGSAVLNMLRQVGLAVGVAVFVAVIGDPRTGAATLSAYRHGWEMIALASLISAILGAVLLRRRPPAVAPGPGSDQTPAAVAIPEAVGVAAPDTDLAAHA